MTSGNWASLAFASVQRRGFHANVPLHCKDATGNEPLTIEAAE